MNLNQKIYGKNFYLKQITKYNMNKKLKKVFKFLKIIII